jgi:hypothetical protein
MFLQLNICLTGQTAEEGERGEREGEKKKSI